jgi:acetyl esterase/lipase
MRNGLSAAVLLPLLMSAFPAQAGTLPAKTPEKGSLTELVFDDTKFKKYTKEVNGHTVQYRAYEQLLYVQNPTEPDYQIINIYIPEAYFEGQSIDGFTAHNAPIFFPNGVGGYMPAKPIEPGENRMGGGDNASLVALSKGYVVASAGARGRTLQNDTGEYTGKAPADIVDLKAAVRYLHFNDQRMPGDANRIVSNGTSAGGAMSVLLGATGDHQDYEPYLDELGAAKASDQIWAVSAYCPITNLEHADSAYEWQFKGLTEYEGFKIEQIDYHVKRTSVSGSLTQAQIKTSNALADQFPSYLNGLALTTAEGKALRLDQNGEGSFKEYIESLVVESANEAISSGADLSGTSWLKLTDGKASSIDYDAYIAYALRAKLPPAFDGLDLTTGENDLFGDANKAAAHFTAFSLKHDTAGGEMADESVIKMMNPMPYLDDGTAHKASHWRIRHGTYDRDTSLAIPALLALKVQSEGYDVDFALPWDRPHSGDYDLDELFHWVKTRFDQDVAS